MSDWLDTLSTGQYFAFSILVSVVVYLVLAGLIGWVKGGGRKW